MHEEHYPNVEPVSSEVRTRDLRRQYLSLGLGELAAAAMFLLVAVLVVADSAYTWKSFLLGCSLAPLLFVLVQGGFYWLLALGWMGRSRMPVGLARVFALLRTINVGVLVLALACIGFGAAHASPLHVAACLGIWLFGVVEYINYFHMRLSYPACSWLTRVREWRRPRLIRDVERSLMHRRNAVPAST